jgi:hypothetical protein
VREYKNKNKYKMGEEEGGLERRRIKLNKEWERRGRMREKENKK